MTNLKQKIEATILVLFSFVPLKFIWVFFEDLINYREEYPLSQYDRSQPSDIFFGIGKFIVLNEKLISVSLIVFAALFLLITWSLTSFHKKILNSVRKLFSTLYFLIFGFSIVLFFRFASDLLILIFIIPYIETVWKFTKKSLSRKYFNSLFLIFNAMHWYYSSGLTGRISVDYGAFILISYALFFYLISLIIAAVEIIIKRSKNKPESNSMLSEQAIEQ